jgi:uncharacterized membrane protein YraQ (UPF0718 family)
MIADVRTIVQSVVAAFVHIWPYLLLTIPLAVAVQMSGASRYIRRAFQGQPIVAILLATAVGAFSPFCSCGVIPVIAALLIGGVPLAPVMSFWIASPSMDPEAFFLSVATLGWNLAVWRLAATLVLSLGAGLVTHVLQQRGWLRQEALRTRSAGPVQGIGSRLQSGWRVFKGALSAQSSLRLATSSATVVSETACCAPLETGKLGVGQKVASESCGRSSESCGCDSGGGEPMCAGEGERPDRFWPRLLRETAGATWMVVKFMALAFVINALTKLYVPQEWVAGLLGHQNPWAIVTAALLGVPAYASNMTALPMVGGLMVQGMNPAAALAFLIAGPTTTLPAMAAVQGLTTRRVFALYVAFALVGAVIAGYVYSLVMGLVS